VRILGKPLGFRGTLFANVGSTVVWVRQFNLALLGKWCWRMLVDREGECGLECWRLVMGWSGAD
jgi:hypothetical protein